MGKLLLLGIVKLEKHHYEFETQRQSRYALNLKRGDSNFSSYNKSGSQYTLTFININAERESLFQYLEKERRIAKNIKVSNEV